jgi:hypothetical protein
MRFCIRFFVTLVKRIMFTYMHLISRTCSVDFACIHNFWKHLFFMADPIPGVGEEINALMCTVGFSSSCSEGFHVRVKNCGTQIVYLLTTLTKCHAAYCFSKWQLFHIVWWIEETTCLYVLKSVRQTSLKMKKARDEWSILRFDQKASIRNYLIVFIVNCKIILAYGISKTVVSLKYIQTDMFELFCYIHVLNV